LKDTCESIEQWCYPAVGRSGIANPPGWIREMKLPWWHRSCSMQEELKVGNTA